MWRLPPLRCILLGKKEKRKQINSGSYKGHTDGMRQLGERGATGCALLTGAPPP